MADSADAPVRTHQTGNAEQIRILREHLAQQRAREVEPPENSDASWPLAGPPAENDCAN